MADGFRVTEAGDRRVTESGDVRITERLQTASFSFEGTGAEFMLALRRVYGVFAWTASATQVFTGEKVKFAGFSWQADSALSLDAGGDKEGSFSWSCSGSFALAGSRSVPATFDMTADGTLFIASGFSREVGFDWMGVSGLSLVGSRVQQASFSFAATSSFLAEAGLLHNAAFEFINRANALVRVTEDGDRRITEDGSIRVVDLPLATGGVAYTAEFSWEVESTFQPVADLTITISNVDIRFGDVWLNEAETYAHTGGSFKQVVKIYANDNGVWKITR